MPNKKITKKSNTKAIKEDNVEELGKMGSKEAIAKLETIIKKEEDYDKKIMAEIALEECENLYYQPTDNKEDEEFFLSWLITKKTNKLIDMEQRIANLEFSLEKYAIEKKVHEKVLLKNKAKKEDWKYNCIDEMVLWKDNQIAELKEDSEYLKAWIEEAKKMITTKRYKTGIPLRHLMQFDFSDHDDDCIYDDCCDENCCQENDYGFDDCCGDDCCNGEGIDFDSIEPSEIPF